MSQNRGDIMLIHISKMICPVLIGAADKMKIAQLIATIATIIYYLS
jgi:hypothetical protein